MNELNLINKDRLYMMIFMVISSAVILKLISLMKSYVAVKVIEMIFN